MKPEEDKEFGLGICEKCGSNGQDVPICSGQDICGFCNGKVPYIIKSR